MLKQFGPWLNHRQFNAGIIAFVCVMSTLVYMPGTFLASIVLAFVTLRNGAKFGLAVLAWIAVPALALMIKDVFANIFTMTFIHCLIVYVLALTLRNTQRWNDVLCIMTLVFIAFVGLIHFFIPDVASEWQKVLMQFMQNWVSNGQTEPAYWPEIVNMFSKVGTGVIGFALMCFMFIELMLARFWQSIIYNPGAFKINMLKIRVNRWVALLLPISLALVIFTNNMTITDMLPVILFPLMVAGLVLIHCVAMSKSQLRFIVPIVYVFTFVFTYAICLWAIIGFIDAWFNFPVRAKALDLLEKGEK